MRKMFTTVIAISISAAVTLAMAEEIAGNVNWAAIEKQAKVVEAKKLEKDGNKSERREKNAKNAGEPTEQNGTETPPSLKIENPPSDYSPEDILKNENELESVESPSSEIETKTFPLKNYKNVSYSKKLEWFSILPRGEKGYEEVKKLLGVNDIVEPQLLKNYGTPKGTILSAFFFDYKYKKPNIAENFYKRFTDKEVEKSGTFYINHILYADYLIRTKRPKSALRVLPKTSCLINFKYLPICFYYRGVANYIITGDNTNGDLQMAANNGVEKAKILVSYSKTKKKEKNGRKN